MRGKLVFDTDEAIAAFCMYLKHRGIICFDGEVKHAGPGCDDDGHLTNDIVVDIDTDDGDVTPPEVDSRPVRPRIVCLCGSTRFMDAFQAANLRLTLEGKIVLSVGCNTKSDASLGLAPDAKKRLDELHLRKIDLADEVLVLNVGGYIGESTRREITYAILEGKTVKYLEKPAL